MPKTEVVMFVDKSGLIPLLEWLDSLPIRVRDKCIVRIERLSEYGHELRRPEGDYLRDGIYELRIRHGHVNYRILYFFHKRTAVLSHGIVKKDEVPDTEIERAVNRLRKFRFDPEKHTYKE